MNTRSYPKSEPVIMGIAWGVIIACILILTGCTDWETICPSSERSTPDGGRVMVSPVPQSTMTGQGSGPLPVASPTPTATDFVPPEPPPALTFTALAVGPTITPDVPPWERIPDGCTPPPGAECGLP